MKIHHSYRVYILRCRDGSYYTGITNNIERRLREHHNRTDPNCYTAGLLPVVLVWSDWFRFADDAIAFEKQVKGWSRRKKEALIAGDWKEISRLARHRASGEPDGNDLSG